MLGISRTLWIIVTAVVILIAALTVITIFGGGLGEIAKITGDCTPSTNCMTMEDCLEPTAAGKRGTPIWGKCENTNYICCVRP